MKKSIYILSVLIISIFSSCSTAYVSSDYDRGVDFSQYKTFNFFNNIEWGNTSDFDKSRILSSIEQELIKDGLTKSSTPQILIDVSTDERLVERNAGSIGVGSGSYGGGFGMGMSVGIPISTQKIHKNFVIELLDAENQHLIWQGVYKDDVSPNADKQMVIQKAMEKIFAKYPPKK